MNKKLALLIVILAIFATTMQAQRDYRYGLYLGLGANTINATNNIYYDDSEVITKTIIIENEFQPGVFDTIYSFQYLPVNNAAIKPIPTFTIGAFYEMPINDIVSFQINLLYYRYGYELSGNVSQKNISDNNYEELKYVGTLKMSNISSAILLKFNVVENNLSVQAGVTPSYCIRMTKDVERGVLHKTLNYNSDEFSPFNICGTFGISWYFFDCFSCSLNLNLGLLDVLKIKEPYLVEGDTQNVHYRYSDTKSKTNSVYFTVGYRWN